MATSQGSIPPQDANNDMNAPADDAEIEKLTLALSRLTSEDFTALARNEDELREIRGYRLDPRNLMPDEVRILRPHLNKRDYRTPPRKKNLILNKLPPEILTKILTYLSGYDLAQIQLVCKALKPLALDPLLYKALCKREFQFWDEKRLMRFKYAAKALDTKWHELYLSRRHFEVQVKIMVQLLIKEPETRVARLEDLSTFWCNLDAKDILLKHCDPTLWLEQDDVDDVSLAREYWATQALQVINRAKAIEMWEQLRIGTELKPEEALGAYDMFILNSEGNTIDDITHNLDNLKNMVQERQVKEGHPPIDSLTQRHKAKYILETLWLHKCLGMDNQEVDYHKLQSNYAGVAIYHDGRPSLPLISASIFIAALERHGIKAHFLAVLGHVYAAVDISDRDKPGGPLSARPHDRIYFDPFYGVAEVSLDFFTEHLQEWHITLPDDPELPDHPQVTNLRDIVLRCSRNIQRTCALSINRPLDPGMSRSNGWGMYGCRDVDEGLAMYSTQWATCLLGWDHPPSQQYALSQLVKEYQLTYWMDGALIEKYLCDPERSLIEAEVQRQMRRIINYMRQHTQLKPPVKSRRYLTAGTVKYFVGQMFKHASQRYVGVIVGWEEGVEQTFYHVLAIDNTIRNLGSNSIMIYEPSHPPDDLLQIAGKFFKRWDTDTRRFISNIKEEYPDD